MAEYILQVKDLHFWYGEIHALKGISLNVEKNGVVSLLGANGAGKTTTLQYISGLIKGKHAGEIWYMGNVLTENLPIHYQRSALRSVLKVGASFPSFRYVKT